MIKILTAILFVLMLVVGGERGMKSFLTLLGNGVILLVAVILIANGLPIIPITVVMTLALCGLTLFYQNETNEKTKAAFYTVLLVCALMLVIIVPVALRADISGYNEINIQEDSEMTFNKNIAVDMVQLEIAVIIIAILGSVKDASIAITTGVYEVYHNNPDMEKRELMKTGLNIGHDILGTTINTLLFASVGESILLINRFFGWHYSFSTLINSKAFFQQYFILISGAIGIVLSIPISAFFMIRILENKKNNKKM